MTMTLNSPTFQDLVEEDYRELLGGRLLAAAYGGSSVFLSRSRYLSDIGDFDGLSLTTDEDEDENLVLPGDGGEPCFGGRRSADSRV